MNITPMQALGFLLMSKEEKMKVVKQDGEQLLKDIVDLTLKVELDMPGSHQESLRLLINHLNRLIRRWNKRYSRYFPLDFLDSSCMV